jgi:hypothetical protein
MQAQLVPHVADVSQLPPQPPLQSRSMTHVWPAGQSALDSQPENRPRSVHAPLPSSVSEQKQAESPWQ